ncbi:MAG: RidA family protein [Bacteroidia bacterium]|nr:RidA family protein [Bacteroidia bacterium]
MKHIIQTAHAPAPIGPYSQAVQVGSLLYVSGQVGINPETGEVVTGGVAAEARQVMRNIAAILTAADASFEQVVKTTIFLRNMEDFGAVNEVYGTYFTGTFPARETVAVAGLPKNVMVEISVTAWMG